MKLCRKYFTIFVFIIMIFNVVIMPINVLAEALNFNDSYSEIESSISDINDKYNNYKTNNDYILFIIPFSAGFFPQITHNLICTRFSFSSSSLLISSATSTLLFDSTTLMKTSSIVEGEISHSFVHLQFLISFKKRGRNLIVIHTLILTSYLLYLCQY